MGEPAGIDVLITDLVSNMQDHGEFVVAGELLSRGARRPDVRAILCARGKGKDFRPTPAAVRTNRLFISRDLRRELRRDRVRAVLYLPSASASLGALVRSASLRWAVGQDSRLVVFPLQQRPASLIERLSWRLFGPHFAVVTSASARAAVKRLLRPGSTVSTVSLGVDTGRFRPPGPDATARMKRELGLDPTRPVVLHVGHLRVGRNTSVLERIAETGAQVVMVASVSRAADPGVEEALTRAGVVVVRRWFEHVEDVYQAADCYVFPVEAQGHAIDTPLSVLEALACGVPVVSTRFGALPELFASTPAVSWATTSDDFAAAVSRVLDEGHNAEAARAAVIGLDWERTVDGILDALRRPEEGPC